MKSTLLYLSDFFNVLREKGYLQVMNGIIIGKMCNKSDLKPFVNAIRSVVAEKYHLPDLPIVSGLTTVACATVVRVLTKSPFQNVFVNTHKSLFFSSVKKEIIKRNQVFEDAFLILIGSQFGYYDEDG